MNNFGLLLLNSPAVKRHSSKGGMISHLMMSDRLRFLINLVDLVDAYQLVKVLEIAFSEVQMMDN